MNEDDIEIEPAEVRRRLARGGVQLVDVRKPWEHSYARIEGSTLIPLDQLPGRIAEIDRTREVILYCHHGVRSLIAADMLRTAGIAALSMTGGIDRWSAEIDRDVPTY